MKIELNPQYITLEGIELVLMSKKEYEKIEELIEDLEDIRDLEEAKQKEDPKERISLRDFINSQWKI